MATWSPGASHTGDPVPDSGHAAQDLLVAETPPGMAQPVAALPRTK